MSLNQKTLLLDQSAWDLVLDINGNIAVASAPYSVAQDVASATRTFLGECPFDTSQGLPYWQNILGQHPPISYIQQQLVNAAMSVPNVTKAVAHFNGYSNRVLTGQIQVTDVDGNTSNIGYN